MIFDFLKKRREKKVRSLLRLWDELLKLNSGNIEFRIIARCIRIEEVRERAWFKLLENIREEDLSYLMVFLDRQKDGLFRDEIYETYYKCFLKERLMLMREGKNLPYKITPVIHGNRNISKEIGDLIADLAKRKIIEEMIRLSA